MDFENSGGAASRASVGDIGPYRTIFPNSVVLCRQGEIQALDPAARNAMVRWTRRPSHRAGAAEYRLVNPRPGRSRQAGNEPGVLLVDASKLGVQVTGPLVDLIGSGLRRGRLQLGLAELLTQARKLGACGLLGRCGGS